MVTDKQIEGKGLSCNIRGNDNWYREGGHMEEVRNTRGHRVTLNNRGAGTITGVNAVISFDPNEVLLETEQGVLLIKGSELNVTKLTLDNGEVDVDGKVDSFTYSDMKPGIKGENGLLNRLFK